MPPPGCPAGLPACAPAATKPMPQSSMSMCHPRLPAHFSHSLSRWEQLRGRACRPRMPSTPQKRAGWSWRATSAGAFQMCSVGLVSSRFLDQALGNQMGLARYFRRCHWDGVELSCGTSLIQSSGWLAGGLAGWPAAGVVLPTACSPPDSDPNLLPLHLAHSSTCPQGRLPPLRHAAGQGHW